MKSYKISEMSVKPTEQSILTLVPAECLKIIKNFNEEKRIQIPVTITSNTSNIFDRVTMYKGGYRFERVTARLTNVTNNTILSDIYIDDIEGVIDLLMCIHYQHGDLDDDEDDIDDFNKTIIWYIENTLITGYCRNTDEDKLKSFFYGCIGLVGTCFSKPA